MRRRLAWLVDAAVRDLTREMEHARRTRALALRSALDEHTEVQRLRARVKQLEALLINPNTLKEQ